MTKSFGNPGRKPAKPVKRPNPPDRSAVPGFGQNLPESQTELPAWSPNRDDAPESQVGDAEPIDDKEYLDPHKPDPNKRIVALLFDFAAAYLVGVIIAMIPFVNRVIPLQIVLVAVLLGRDYLFGGRGFGKNLMGLRVVDANTGEAPTLIQSALRNIVLMAPFVVLQTVPLLLRFSPFTWLNEAVMSLINIVGMIYVAIVLPLESYRAYSRDDGLRIGDELAGTVIVDSTMDFSNPFNR
jgi:uncharacterized RDD family membrane protein YckC